MKLDGQTVDNEEAIEGPVVIQRGKKFFAFYASPVWSFDPFHERVPKPEPPPSAWGKGGKKQYDWKNPVYLEELQRYGRQQWGYLVLTSLLPSNLDLTDQGVDYEDPETWDKVEAALTYDAETNPQGLSHFEFKKVMDLVDGANLLNSEKVEANLESFFQQVARQEEPGESSPNGEPESSPSGERAKDGE